ncbi:lachrymatory-factor synthase [Iris pallida]|uniref:Lachrymatory-factor synthase n=1 Tax=Iris pallida TaxID=29817 RepID=A0AAX6DLK4_IRIPA|nr:lachrymatory-factor synthase [Iris pallida]
MEEKWEGVITSTKLPGVTPAQAWALLGDYYSLHKYFPSIVLSCSKVTELCDGKPGSFRYTTAILPGSPQLHWCKDRLVAMDAQGMSYTYEVIENSMGFGKMEVTLKVVPADGDGCMVQWTYDGEPAAGWTHDKFAALLHTGAGEMSKLVGEALAEEIAKIDGATTDGGVHK